MSDLLVSTKDRVRVICLNRPERKNAFTFEMIDAWADALRDAASDEEVRVVVVTGAGDAFCSGVDLESLEAVEPTPLGRKYMLTERVHRVALALEDLDKPVIAAVKGPAMGAGMDMALLCDMRIAGTSARFAESYIRIGLVPGDGGAFLLPRLVGSAKALELLWTGDAISAEEALRLGIVNRVVEDDQLEAETHALAVKIAKQSPIAVRLIKQAVRQGAHLDLRTSLDLISSHMAVVMSTEDYDEARRAVKEGRPADFKGR